MSQNSRGVLPPPRRTKGNHLTYKVLLLGDPAVGKSNLLLRFSQNEFDIHSKATIGVEFVTREIDIMNGCFATPETVPKDVVNMQIWDTAGQERCGLISTAYYRNAKGIIVVYDTTRKSTLLQVPRWVAHAKQYCDANAVFIVVGNKNDLTNLRETTEEEAEEISHILGVRHYYASALTGENVPTAFFQMVLAVHAVNTSSNETVNGSKREIDMSRTLPLGSEPRTAHDTIPLHRSPGNRQSKSCCN